MEKRLSHKEKGFIEDILSGKTGTQAVLDNYDTNNEKVAGVMAVENLGKPRIQKAMSERISDDELEVAHKSLLTQVRLDYFVFSKSMSDEEITSHVEAQGLTVLNIRPSEKGKLAFFSLPDAAARGKGVELGYKVKGTFAPDKHVTLNLTPEASPRIKELAKKLNQ